MFFYDLRHATASMLEQLVTTGEQPKHLRQHNPAKGDNNAPKHPYRWMQKRLSKLEDHGYVVSRRAAITAPQIWSIANKGADEVMLEYGIERTRTNWSSKNRSRSDRNYEHSLMIANFRLALELALRDRPQTTIERWWPDGRFETSVTITETVETRRRKGKKTANRTIKKTVPLVPDAHFLIKDGEDRHYFFLEADRSNKDHTFMRRRYSAYYHLWKDEIFKQPDNPYDMPGFRVITLTYSELRKENLRATAKTVDDKKQGTGIHWFLCEKAYLNNPTALFEENWHNAKDDALHHLID